MNDVYLIALGKPYEMGKIYTALKKEFFNRNYCSDEYKKMIFIPKKVGEIDVIDKKGYLVFCLEKEKTICSHFSTKFRRDKGKTFGIFSKLVLEIHSKNFEVVSKILEKLEKLNSSFNYERRVNFNLSLDSLIEN